MDIKTIVEKYRNGEYNHNIKYGNKVPENYIFDADLSVKRNREMVAEHNAKVEADRKSAYSKQAELDRKLAYDVCCYITENYNLSHTVATKIEQFCYQEKHSYMFNYFSYIDTIAELVDDIIYMMKDNGDSNG